ncbi:hypothetical protein D3C87_325150 [compost metagenome]
MRAPGARGRPVQVNLGDRFVVTTSEVWNSTNPPKIMREANAMLGCGYAMDIKTINQLFEEV